MDGDNKTNHKKLQENIDKSDDEYKEINEKNEMNYTGVFLSIGAGLGVSFGILFDNLTIGISLGTALGLVVGAVVESVKKKK
ncbi:glycine zipper family protein [Faecalicatena contorta]|uniref:Glycine zipper-like domain-containing protein n=1 Tax=Faecalicatena contorta TaxID=39482 RepID=A0A315ZTJ1_9FIRM|nr:glycine zipper family protein [Faecalicatena contorta]PWJ48044.1 hypothetical protein A8805_11419 [Faecalicatena contorta]SUQ15571.1 hypothetical protein SAMN05216529_11419 [Faecalicatena contorta]